MSSHFISPIINRALSLTNYPTVRGSLAMRLLDCATLRLKDFNESNVPDYAILSHTWGSQEVTFDDMTNPAPDIYRLAGYRKVKHFADRVVIDGWNFIWVDTCCIKKDSSTELSEAINSMYTWYKNARRCYVYLDDMDAYDFLSFQNCRWLSRGWTLQELIAPADVHFYSKNWEFMFTKETIAVLLSEASGIGQEVLLTCDPNLASVAQRMSWAARRVATRPEDMAYCLLGIFDVNMPMLYGEGGLKAFIRLQEEIMKISDDQSLFAWKNKHDSYSSYTGLLAPSPREFVDSPDIAFVEKSFENRPYLNTNKGISIRLNLVPHRADIDEPDVYIALLDCRDPGPEGSPIGIFLKRLEGNQFARVDAHRVFNALHSKSEAEESNSPAPEPINLYVRQRIRLPRNHLTPRVYGFVVTELIRAPGMYLAGVWPEESWNPKDKCLHLFPSERSKFAVLCYRYRNDLSFGALAAILSWNRKSRQLSTFWLRDQWWTEDLSIEDRVKKEQGTTFSRNVEEWVEITGCRRRATISTAIGMRDSEVVINVGVTVEGVF